ncbi:MAG: ABC transporter ATP-binding protein [Ignavibacteriales bacterium]|nr:ABC transporter ATP-binding protein [Ignavibacteriales bacterium]
MLELRKVTKKFGSFAAVEDLSLAVRSGEFFGFLGPNGAGKTTTIKMIAGLFTPSSGTILINGHDTVREPLMAKLTLGYIPDQPFLYDKLTGREFLYFVGGLFKQEKPEIARVIEDLIAHFEIGDWVDKRTEDYSLGMRQRITIASALVHHPKVIVIDEPMVGLDPRSAKIVKETLRQKARGGAAVFMSTHSLQVAEELCDRIGIIKNGRLIFMDTLEKLEAYKKQYDGKFESVFLELTK